MRIETERQPASMVLLEVVWQNFNFKWESYVVDREVTAFCWRNRL